MSIMEICYNYKKSMKTGTVDKNIEFLKFKEIWEYESKYRIEQTANKWDQRALEQEKILSAKNVGEKGNCRAKAMREFLQKEGVLNSSYSVIDIGCGRGAFIMEIAPFVRCVKGIDFSTHMCRLGEKYTREKALNNVTFEVCDFTTCSLRELTKNGKYDLVCSSITPAIRSYESFEKMISLSSSYCFNVSFVYKENQLYLDILKDVFGKTMENGYDGHWHSFYAMFNMLFLKGYYPITGYFDEHKNTDVDISDANLDKVVENVLSLIYTRPQNAKARIKDYLNAKYGNAKIVKTSDMRRFGAILWSVSTKTAR